MIKRNIALALASLLLLTSCGAAEPDPLTSLTEYQTQELEWRDCYGNFQCSNLLVPIDYQDLSVGRSHLLCYVIKHLIKIVGLVLWW